MPNARVKLGETPEHSRVRYNAEMAAYRRLRKEQGRPIKDSVYVYAADKRAALFRKYGLTPAQADTLLEAQSGGCAICQTPLTLDNRGKQEHSAIDHCHTTGRVRGVLCMHCNQGLGKFYDNPELLRKAANYLLP